MKFEKRVRQIASAEKDVDKVLNAARLQRNPISDERLEMILTYLFLMVMMFCIFGFFVFLTIMRG